METKPRDIHLVGSVPLKPAATVFETLEACLGSHLHRLPDGEQTGWVEGVRATIAAAPALEPSRTARLGTVAGFANPSQMYRLKSGHRLEETRFGELGIAKNALRSYEAFRAMKARGALRPDARFQATIPGPATAGGMLDMPEADAYALIEPALAAEIGAIVLNIPAADLTVQIDLAVEVCIEEFRQRPGSFDTPIFALRNFTLPGTTQSVARLAARIPREVEFGIHLCGMWHLDKSGGQDLKVHVHYANVLLQAINRPIAYLHLPTTPEFGVEDFRPLSTLALSAGTQLFLGLIHAVDGLDGARRRIEAARQIRPEFGVSHFCGLSQWGAGPETVVPMLELHRAAAAET